MSKLTYTVSPDGTAILCHFCGNASHNQRDIAERYCAHCKLFHGDQSALQELLHAQRTRADEALGRATILAAQLAGWEAQCAAQVAVLQDLQSYLHGAPYSVDTLKRRIEVVTETNAGQLVLKRLQVAHAVAEAVRALIQGHGTIAAVRAAADAYELALIAEGKVQ